MSMTPCSLKIENNNLYPQTRNIGCPDSTVPDFKGTSSRNAGAVGLSSLDTRTQTDVKDRQLQKCHQELEVGSVKEFSLTILKFAGSTVV